MMTATVCPTSGELRAFSLGELPAEQSDELFRHLQACPNCKSELETIGDAEDSLIASLRTPDPLAGFDREPDCQVAVAKALGALAIAGDAITCTDLDRLPKSIGEYEIIRPLGRGGMGNVYLARHTKLGREVALKVLAGHRLADPRMRERFAGEMRAVGQLSHPNIVTAHDAREVDGTAVLVTEYIDGFDLGQLVSRVGPLKIANACEIIRKVAAALQYTGNQGFVHRDVKPSNIMVSTAGEVKLLDLGLARLQYGQADGVEITGTGQAMGTADYVAPEQVSDSRSVDIRADIYSLGCTLFKLLTGSAPFADPRFTTAFAKMTAHVSHQPPGVGDAAADTPARLAKLVDSMLSKDPNDRPQTPLEVAEKLTPFAAPCDLTDLVSQAATATPHSNRSWSTSPTSTAKPWFSRPVPVSLAIGAGFLGLALGLLMGIVITIKYPDGTTVTVPVTPGSDVSIEDVPDNRPAVAARGAMPVDVSAFAKYSPLAFVVLVEEGGRSPNQIKAAKETLQRSDGGEFVSTDAGIWYQINGDVQVPISAEHQRRRYGLVETDIGSWVRWSDLQGHIVSAQVGGGSSNLRLEFDDQLAKRMSQVTGENLNRQLAVVVDHRIVSAPHIRSKLSNAAEVTGSFTPEETRFLMQAIQGGLVAPISREDVQSSEAESAADEKMNARIQGVWKVVSLADADGNKVDVKLGLVAFNKDRFFFIEEDGRVEIAALGTFQLKTENRVIRIELTYVIPVNNPGDVVSTIKFLPGERLQIVASHTVSASETLVSTMDLERTDTFPKTTTELQALLLGDQAAHAGASMAEAVDQIFAFMDSSKLTESQLAQFKRTIQTQKSLVDTRNNLKQIGLAFHNFHNAYKKFPGTSNLREGAVRTTDKQVQPFSWRVAILPFIEQEALFRQYRFDEPWDSEANLKLLDKMPAVYRSPLAAKDQSAGHTNYQGFATDESVLGTNGGHQISEITDGTFDTLLVIESTASAPWTKPQDLTETPEFFAGQPINILFVDGSVLPKEKVNEDYLQKIITRNGGEPVDR